MKYVVRISVVGSIGSRVCSDVVDEVESDDDG